MYIPCVLVYTATPSLLFYLNNSEKSTLSVCLCLSVLCAIFSRWTWPWVSQFIEAKDDGSGGDNWSYVLQSFSQIITNKPTPNFLRGRCPSCHNQQYKSTEGNLWKINWFNHFWCTMSWRKLSLENYKLAHITYKQLPQYIGKCKWKYNIQQWFRLSSWLFQNI